LLFNLLLSLVLNGLIKKFHSIEEEDWSSPDIISSQIAVIAFNCPKFPVLHRVIQYSKEPKVARTQVWQIKWAGKAFKFRAGDL
jgi:hypothetical protein